MIVTTRVSVSVNTASLDVHATAALPASTDTQNAPVCKLTILLTLMLRSGLVYLAAK